MDVLSLDTVVLQTDNEPAIVALSKAVKETRLPKETRLRGAPVEAKYDLAADHETRQLADLEVLGESHGAGGPRRGLRLEVAG